MRKILRGRHVVPKYEDMVTYKDNGQVKFVTIGTRWASLAVDCWEEKDTTKKALPFEDKHVLHSIHVPY